MTNRASTVSSRTEIDLILRHKNRKWLHLEDFMTRKTTIPLMASVLESFFKLQHRTKKWRLKRVICQSVQKKIYSSSTRCHLSSKVPFFGWQACITLIWPTARDQKFQWKRLLVVTSNNKAETTLCLPETRALSRKSSLPRRTPARIPSKIPQNDIPLHIPGKILLMIYEEPLHQ